MLQQFAFPTAIWFRYTERKPCVFQNATRKALLSIVWSHITSDNTCLSLHLDTDGSFSETKKKLYFTHKKRFHTRQSADFLTHEATINAYHYSTTM
jgi:hypothetical protein